MLNKKQQMKNINPLGLFDEHFLLERLTKLNDPLIKLGKYIDWNIFLPVLNHALINLEKAITKGGRPSFDKPDDVQNNSPSGHVQLIGRPDGISNY